MGWGWGSLLSCTPDNLQCIAHSALVDHYLSYVYYISWTVASVTIYRPVHTLPVMRIPCAFNLDSSVHTLMRIGVDAHSNALQ